MNLLPNPSHGSQEQYVRNLEEYLERLIGHHTEVHVDCLSLPVLQLDGHSLQSPAAQVDSNPLQTNETRGKPTELVSAIRRTPKFENRRRRHQSKRSDWIQWQPSSLSPQPRNTGADNWKPLAKQLIDGTPQGRNWMMRIQELQIHDVINNGIAADYVSDGLAATPYVSVNVSCPAGSRCDVLTAVQNYAESAATRFASANCVMMLVNFQKFLVLCICAVLSRMDFSKEALINITRICFGNVSDEYAVRLWRTALFLNELIDKLDIQGWGGRATQLLLVCTAQFRPKWSLSFTAFRESASDFLLPICRCSRCRTQLFNHETWYRLLYKGCWRIGRK
jgi:hypothetical protein